MKKHNWFFMRVGLISGISGFFLLIFVELSSKHPIIMQSLICALVGAAVSILWLFISQFNKN